MTWSLLAIYSSYTACIALFRTEIVISVLHQAFYIITFIEFKDIHRFLL